MRRALSLTRCVRRARPECSDRLGTTIRLAPAASLTSAMSMVVRLLATATTGSLSACSLARSVCLLVWTSLRRLGALKRELLQASRRSDRSIPSKRSNNADGLLQLGHETAHTAVDRTGWSRSV
jgi:hypothetical protein